MNQLKNPNRRLALSAGAAALTSASALVPMPASAQSVTIKAGIQRSWLGSKRRTVCQQRSCRQQGRKHIFTYRHKGKRHSLICSQ